MASSQVRILKLHSRSATYVSSVVLRHFSSTRESTAAFNDDERKRQNQDQNPPQPIPNRPLRGGRPVSKTPLATYHRLDIPKNDNNDNDSISDDAFLDKFKLRRDNTSDTPHNQNPQPTNSDPPQDAAEIFKKMKEAGLIPNAVAMLDGLCKDGLLQEAMKLFASMRETGTIPQVVIYTAVVEGFCKAHKFDDAKRIFTKMQTNGVTPNAFTYTILIQGFCKSNLLDDGIDFCLQMLDAGHSPNVTTFVALVDGLCRLKGVQEAQTVIATFQQKGFHVHDKAVRDFLDKKAPFSSSVWEAIFGKKPSRKPF